MNDQKLDVIRKLLAKAEGAATPEEADAYNAKAAELMARHGIDEALLAATGEKRDEIATLKVDTPNPYPRAKADLLGGIGEALRCQVVFHGATGTRCRRVTLIGFESDLARVELLYTSLLLQGTRQVVHARPSWHLDESLAAFRRSWWTGFTHVVCRRLALAEQRAARERDQDRPGTGAELVLADRAQLVRHRKDEMFGKLKDAPRVPDGSGYNNGADAGRRADIGGKRIADAGRRSIGGAA